MDIQAELVAPCSTDTLFSWVEDLGRYPQWLEIVTKAVPQADESWAVDLRGKLGPLARTKRLRMCRTTFEPGTRVVFERCELDGRQHSPWVLEATVSAVGEDARLDMGLHYGGGLFGPVIERVLGDEIERSRLRLLGLVAAPGGQ